MYMYTVSEPVVKGIEHIGQLCKLVEEDAMSEHEFYLSVRAIMVTIGELKTKDDKETESIKEEKPLVMPDEEFPELEAVSEAIQYESRFKKLVENIRTWRK